MSDNDSLRPEDFEPHRVEPEARNPKATLMAVFREQPLLRLVALILPVIILVVVVIGVFGHSKTQVASSKVGTPSTIKNIDNATTTNQSYQKALDEEHQRQLERAQAQGTSLIAPSAPGKTTPVDEAKNDPLAQFKLDPVVVTPQPIAPAIAPTAGIKPPVVPPPTAAPAMPAGPKPDQQLASAFTGEMRSIIGGLNGQKVSVIRVTAPQDPAKATPPAASGAGPGTPGSANERDNQLPKIIMAGTVVYGQTLNESDSDIPTPVLVTVLSGALANSRAIGSFRTVHAADDYLILAFGTIIKGQKEYRVNAIAIDPETTLSGLETDVDHHYFERFVLPAAAGFISGVGNYTQQAGSTVTYGTYGVSQSYPPLNTHQELLSGLGQGANSIAQAIQSESNLQPTVYLAPGTGIGLLFVNSVREVSQ